MPKDSRLYMTFPIDFPDHPKVKPLSAAAKWAFVEMNAYSRRQDLDGVIPVRAARTMWTAKVLAELVSSHDERPLVTFTDDTYVIRDYSQHQFTTEDLAELHTKRARAGSLGGKAKANAKQVLEDPLAKVKQNVAGSESRSETVKTTSLEVVPPRKRGTRIPEPFIVTAQMRQWAADRTPGVSVDASTEKFVNYWRSKTRDAAKLDWLATWHNWLISDFDRLPNRKPSKESQIIDVLDMGARLQAAEDQKALGA